MPVRVFYAILTLWVCVACTSVSDGQTIVVDDSARDITHTLALTINNATSSTNQAVSGQLVLTSRTYGDTRRLSLRSSGTITPNWLIPYGGALTIITTPTDTWLVDDGCVRDGSMLPIITMRDILGPLTGFLPDGDTLTSQQRGASWQRLQAQAQRNTAGQLTTLTGTGTGKLLLPGGDVIRGDIRWDYHTNDDRSAIVIPSHCSDTVYASLSLPTSCQNRRPYGGAILAETTLPLAQVAPELVAWLITDGWQAHILQQDMQQVVIEASAQTATVRIFLATNSQLGVDLTMVIQP
jgi:hypothetical protein